jgi:hypothetical protein
LVKREALFNVPADDADVDTIFGGLHAHGEVPFWFGVEGIPALEVFRAPPRAPATRLSV